MHFYRGRGTEKNAVIRGLRTQSALTLIKTNLSFSTHPVHFPANSFLSRATGLARNSTSMSDRWMQNSLRSLRRICQLVTSDYAPTSIQPWTDYTPLLSSVAVEETRFSALKSAIMSGASFSLVSLSCNYIRWKTQKHTRCEIANVYEPVDILIKIKIIITNFSDIRFNC